MSDYHHTPMLSPNKNPSSPISSFLNSPRFFNGFLSKNLFSDTDTNIMSPTSILDTKTTSNFVNPFGHDNILCKFTNPIGLALIDSIVEEKSYTDTAADPPSKISKPINRTSLYGSKLKVQIPVINPTSSVSPNGSPESPGDFGIKTKNSQIASPCSSNAAVKCFTRQLSLKEMELCEDYTCVITRGPNPKTTHIFDDCVVESCLGDESVGYGCKKMEFGFGNNVSTSSASRDFLSFCHTCKDVLEQGKDIYIYRGEKAFCSNECRCQEIIFEGINNPDFDE